MMKMALILIMMMVGHFVFIVRYIFCLFTWFQGTEELKQSIFLSTESSDDTISDVNEDQNALNYEDHDEIDDFDSSDLESP